MKKVIILLALFAIAGANQVDAQAAMHYDLYYGLPGESGARTVDVGLAAADISSIGDLGDVNVMGKYSLSDKLEVGAVATLGLLHDFRDDLSAISAGGKWSLSDMSALTATAAIPVGDVDDLGLSLGIMHTRTVSGITVNHLLAVGLLDGYTFGTGINIAALIEPTKEFNEKLVGYLDVIIGTNTDSIGDNLAIDLGPNVDIMLNDMITVNAGVTLGIAGDLKQEELGIVATAIIGL
jgi:hypothetical protein